MRKLVWAALAAAGGLAAATGAQAAVTVIGGGMAEECAKATVRGASDAATQDLCTAALETEFLDSRDRAGTYVNRGVLQMRRKEWSGAEKDFNTALRIKPDLGEGYVNRGAAYIGQAKFAQSLPEINKGLQLGVEEPHKAYYNRALAHEGLEDAKSAYLDYQQALTLAPGWEAPRKELTRFTVSRP